VIPKMSRVIKNRPRSENRNYMYSKMYYIIQILSMRPIDLPISKLAENLKVNTTYLRRILDILETAGFIVIRKSRSGTRGRPAILVSITEKCMEYQDIFDALPKIIEIFSDSESVRKKAEEYCQRLKFILEKWAERESSPRT